MSIEAHDPAVILKNYKLIFYFLTAPICRDPTTIGKIVNILTENIVSPHGHQNLFNACDMRHYEKIVSEVHYKKLILLSKLIMKSVGSDASEYKYIETNPKKLNSNKMVGSKKDENLPSKFQKED